MSVADGDASVFGMVTNPGVKSAEFIADALKQSDDEDDEGIDHEFHAGLEYIMEVV